MAVQGPIFASIRPAATLVEVECPDRPIAADRDRGRRAVRADRHIGSGGNSQGARDRDQGDRSDDPDEQFRRHAVRPAASATASHSIPTWKAGVPASSATTIVLTAASAGQHRGADEPQVVENHWRQAVDARCEERQRSRR